MEGPPESTDASTPTHTVTFLVVGGGIAGVSCAEALAILCPDEPIMLLTESSVIKTVANLEPVARYLHKFDVVERSVSCKGALAPCILTIIDQLQSIDAARRYAQTRGNLTIEYRQICLCTGGLPRLIATDNRRVLGIRDTDSVLELQRQLQAARRIVLVGNGGIASELAYELNGVEVHWAIKDKHIAATFVDAGAAHFFQKSHGNRCAESCSTTGAVKRLRYSELLLAEHKTGEDVVDAEGKTRGAALGPDWHRNFALNGGGAKTASNTPPIIHYQAYVKDIAEGETNGGIVVTLSTGESIDCDFVVSATGVDPRLDYFCQPALALAADGGIAVDEMMATNVADVYAAGDVCTASWTPAEHWFQMRLWTQARQMGAMAGRSMAAALLNERIYQDFCFELFGHVTQLFGHAVVLLGRYNGQGLGTDYELLLRTTPGKEYVKFVLQRGRLRGAILIGNTELAETCENLILNGIDLTAFGDDILNPDIDIEDFFD